MCEVPEWDEEDGSDTGLELDNELLTGLLLYLVGDSSNGTQ